jgi:hypothetical protein
MSRRPRQQGKKDMKEGKDGKDGGMEDPIQGTPTSPVIAVAIPDEHEGSQAVSAQGSSDTNLPATPGPAPAPAPTPASEFTRSLIEALKNPEVQTGFQHIMRPMMVSYIDESLKSHQDKIEDLEIDVCGIKEDVSEHKAKMEVANSSILSRIRELERQQKSRNVRITGLSIDEEPGQSLQDKCRNAVGKLLAEAHIEGVSVADFETITKINIPNQNGPSVTLIGRLNTETKKVLLVQQKKKTERLFQKVLHKR